MITSLQFLPLLKRHHMNWFTRITGFAENNYALTRSQLEVHGNTLLSKVNGHSYGVGEFEFISLKDLRSRVASSTGGEGRVRVQIVVGDVRKMHQAPEYAGALFQVASQFNALEMMSPRVTPEHGVTIYDCDRTQGPACAMAAGAATIYRNYFAPVGGQIGQTAERQLDGLAELGIELSTRLKCTVSDLWEWCNGYALCTSQSLKLISDYLKSIDSDETEALAAKLRVGIHRDVEVTDTSTRPGPLVSQIFCSALPVAYGDAPQQDWTKFAQLVLNAAYEATMLEAVMNSRHGKSNIVLLTMLGGGAFGNAPEWIYAAIIQAIEKVRGFDLDVRIVSYQPPSTGMLGLVEQLNN